MTTSRPEFEYRITKYNPAHRNQDGHYLRSEWTSYSDIGKTYNGVRFERSEYEPVEEAYISAALAFLKETGIDSLVISGLERTKDKTSENLDENKSLNAQEEVRMVIKKILREEIWCRLKSEDSFFIHFGWDYYMYIGSNMPCEKAKEAASRMGLFVERWNSPYFDEES